MRTLLLSLLVGCGESTPPAPKDPVARRAALDATLKERLGAAYDAPIPDYDQADLALGAEVWQKSCLPCHGPKGEGNGQRWAEMDPPPGNLLATAGTWPPAAELEIIRGGSPGTAMPDFGNRLPEKDLVAVHAFLQRLRADAKSG